MKSKKALFEALDLYFATNRFTQEKLKAKGISNETYGKKSCIYVNCGEPDVRRQVESFLSTRGFKVNRNYDLGGTCAEVTVSYFKGNNWDE